MVWFQVVWTKLNPHQSMNRFVAAMHSSMNQPMASLAGPARSPGTMATPM